MEALEGLYVPVALALLLVAVACGFAAGSRTKLRVKKINGDEKSLLEPEPPVPGGKPTAEQLGQLMKLRRSIFPKDFSGEPIAREEVEALLEAANWAPTHGRTEPWRFVVLGREAQEAMIDLTLTVCQREMTPDKFEAKQKKMNKKRSDFAKVPFMIMICMKRQPVPGKLNPEWEEECAVACAMQNVYLMTTALGLGGYWSSWTTEARESPEFRHLLGLEEGDKCLGVFMLGQPGDRAAGYRSARGPISEKVTWKV